MNTSHTYDRRSFLGISAGGTLLATLPSAAAWAQARHGKIDYGVASIDALYSAIYVTLKQGYFTAEGLDVSLHQLSERSAFEANAGCRPVVHHDDGRQ